MSRPALMHQTPMAIAHRGSRLLWPENTMAAFQGAVDLGYRFLETDLHATRDGILVTHHDSELDRTTNGTGKISEFSFDQLAQFDAGAKFELDGAQPFLDQGLTVPSLEEVMKTFPETVLTLDLKEDSLHPLLGGLLARWRWSDRVIVGSFSDRRLRKFRKEVKGRVATSAGTVETAKFLATARMGRVPSMAADALQVPTKASRITVVDRKIVAAAHAAMKHVHVWTINDPPEMHRLLDLQVDGIITDRPDLLNEVIAERRGDQ